MKKPLKRVKIEELGVFLRTIYMDYQPKDNAEMAKLITEHFGVLCSEGDIYHYEALCDGLCEIQNNYEDYI